MKSAKTSSMAIRCSGNRRGRPADEIDGSVNMGEDDARDPETDVEDLRRLTFRPCRIATLSAKTALCR